MYQNLNTYELLVMGITLHGFFLAGLMAIGQLIADHKSTKTTKIMPGFFYNPTHMYITFGGSLSLLCYLVSIWKNIQAELIWKPDVIKKEPVAQAFGS